jgi:hypothetical protein
MYALRENAGEPTDENSKDLAKLDDRIQSNQEAVDKLFEDLNKS